MNNFLKIPTNPNRAIRIFNFLKQSRSAKGVRLFVGILAFGLLTYSCERSLESESSIDGYPLRSSQLARIFYIDKNQPSLASLIEFIQVNKPNWQDTPSPENEIFTQEVLAGYINEMAENFGLDRRILLSLIWTESSFNVGAKSRTEALGLTQVTRYGMLEYLHQLGLKCSGKIQVTQDNIDYFLPKVRKYFPEYDKGNITEVIGKNPEECLKSGLRFAAKEKETLRDNPFTQVLVGAVILKAKIAYACARDTNCNDSTWLVDSPANIALRKAMTRKGLEYYNGDKTIHGSSNEPYYKIYARNVINKAETIE